jgi:hypothetical protein
VNKGKMKKEKLKKERENFKNLKAGNRLVIGWLEVS